MFSELLQHTHTLKIGINAFLITISSIVKRQHNFMKSKMQLMKVNLTNVESIKHVSLKKKRNKLK